MEWERAKTFILLFFVLLNLLLGGLLLAERRRYTVSSDREQAIIQIMYRNNIVLDTHLLRRFPPMRAMNVAGFCYDVDEFIGIFFGEAETQVVPARHGDIITDGVGELVIEHGFISYDNEYGLGGAEDWVTNLTTDHARRLTDAFVGDNWPDFLLDYVHEGAGWMRLSYRQVYRGYIIHTNFIELIVTERGIVQVDKQAARVLEWQDRQPISAPDEALLTFVQRIRDHANAMPSPMVITNMDIVYFQEESSTNPDGVYQVVPFFRVFVEGDGGDPFLINAFSNEIIN